MFQEPDEWHAVRDEWHAVRDEWHAACQICGAIYKQEKTGDEAVLHQACTGNQSIASLRRFTPPGVPAPHGSFGGKGWARHEVVRALLEVLHYDASSQQATHGVLG